ncbi:hypothetical protein RhiirC2_707352 [Rhizophagus irregularis]|uniref:Uncharacterized protein n=1 Tax=Rhizophagus irregularis TaxID=588596 RepID=A0A2N1NRL2_9GLOM|nr:hypothetical protein RhiirC2_707352 [Rhizophagus irregularis]
MSEQKSLEDKAVDVFLGEVHKRSVSDGIRRRKREKNLREDDSILKVSSQIESNTEALVASKDIPEVSINQKITYKQKMKQSLRNEPVSACTKSNCSWAKIVFDMEIPEFSLETILTGIQDLVKMIPPKANNTDEVTNCNAHVTEFSGVVCLEQRSRGGSIDRSCEIGHLKCAERDIEHHAQSYYPVFFHHRMAFGRHYGTKKLAMCQIMA